jgi:hypothetical protein
MTDAYVRVLDDLKATAERITVPRFDVPLKYAELVRASLLERGIELPIPESGGEMCLEFTSGFQLSLVIH